MRRNEEPRDGRDERGSWIEYEKVTEERRGKDASSEKGIRWSNREKQRNSSLTQMSESVQRLMPLSLSSKIWFESRPSQGESQSLFGIELLYLEERDTHEDASRLDENGLLLCEQPSSDSGKQASPGGLEQDQSVPRRLDDAYEGRSSLRHDYDDAWWKKSWRKATKERRKRAEGAGSAQLDAWRARRRRSFCLFELPS